MFSRFTRVGGACAAAAATWQTSAQCAGTADDEEEEAHGLGGHKHNKEHDSFWSSFSEGVCRIPCQDCILAGYHPSTSAPEGSNLSGGSSESATIDAYPSCRWRGSSELNLLPSILI